MNETDINGIDEQTKAVIDEATLIAQKILWEIESHVKALEHEIGFLGDAFNAILDRTQELDKKIAELASIINTQKRGNATQILDFLKQEIQTITEQLRGIFTTTNPNDLPAIKENLSILLGNKEYILSQMHGLKAIGVNTSDQEKHLEVLERGITQSTKAMEANVILRITNLIHNQMQIIQAQTDDARNTTDPNDLNILKENIMVLEENVFSIKDEIIMVYKTGLANRALEEHYETLEITLEQFRRTVDEAEARICFSSFRV